MYENSSSTPERVTQRRTYFWRSLGVIAWVIGGFLLASLVVGLVAQLFVATGIHLDTINETVLNTLTAALLYLIAALIVIGLPQRMNGGRFRTDRRQLGAVRTVEFRDVAFAPAAFVVYFIATALVTGLVTHFVPNFNIDQAQDTGFTDLTQGYEYFLAFVTLVIMAPVAEELVFRGYLYGKLRRLVPVWLAILLTSAVFGLVHGQWNVGLDVFVLSLVLCSLREVTGSIWAGVLLHMLKNGLAFYLLFINPTFLHTIGG